MPLKHSSAHDAPQRTRPCATSPRASSAVPLAIVQHANQFIITNGYLNRSGLDETAGGQGDGTGYLKIFELHQKYQVPFNLQISGTLLECLLWYRPDVIRAVRDLLEQGLVELVGSCYAQNVMRFFSDAHNRRQLNEELALYSDHLHVDPRAVKVFWPPERVWDTRRMAPLLADAALLNGGYSQVLVDDRMSYFCNGNGHPSRRAFDLTSQWQLRDFAAYRIFDGPGLVALPIARALRWNIPPRDDDCFEQLEQVCSALAAGQREREDIVAIFGDDLEKSAGIGSWDARGPEQYEGWLAWIRHNRDVEPVKLSDWTLRCAVTEERGIDNGTFVELSNDFGAGEDYEKWYFDPQWELYESYYAISEAKVKIRDDLGADDTLIDLAWKQLLASSWETAWHTPSTGAHGNEEGRGEPSPWIKATASHSRHAIVTAEAAYWMRHRDGAAHAYLADIDEDGEDELILKSDRHFAVFTLRWGGRLVYLFNIDARYGTMVIGNPCDDWNWMEELNRYMQIPANHPGALTDLGCEDDRYQAQLIRADGAEVSAVLTNIEKDSPGCGLTKTLSLAVKGNELVVEYAIPRGLSTLDIECGVSPDYLSLLRRGPRSLRRSGDSSTVRYANGDVSVWIRMDNALSVLDRAEERDFGHGRAVRFEAPSSNFTLRIGSRSAAAEVAGRKSAISRQKQSRFD